MISLGFEAFLGSYRSYHSVDDLDHRYYRCHSATAASSQPCLDQNHQDMHCVPSENAVAHFRSSWAFDVWLQHASSWSKQSNRDTYRSDSHIVTVSILWGWDNKISYCQACALDNYLTEAPLNPSRPSAYKLHGSFWRPQRHKNLNQKLWAVIGAPWHNYEFFRVWKRWNRPKWIKMAMFSPKKERIHDYIIRYNKSIVVGPFLRTETGRWVSTRPSTCRAGWSARSSLVSGEPAKPSAFSGRFNKPLLKICEKLILAAQIPHLQSILKALPRCSLWALQGAKDLAIWHGHTLHEQS